LLILSAAGVVFAGGVAAAANGTNLLPLVGANDDAAPHATIVATSTTLPDAPANSDASGLTDEALEAICDAASNHGEAVSTVAKDDSTQGREHGEAVSAMAQSDCGKDESDETDDEENAEEHPPPVELDDETGLSDGELEAICEAASNHGEAVSAVAKDKSTIGREHGEAVSAMAKSDCGKDSSEADDADADVSSARTARGKGN
jgi:hypothetical protein